MKKRFKKLKANAVRPVGVVKSWRRRPEEKAEEAFQDIPRITNETVAEHRERVLGSARKYIYPLRHSKQRVVAISAALLVVGIIAFFVYCGLALYRLHSSSTFIYGVTKVIPFPVAKAGSRWVSYESYLFELRHYEHYYETQQQVDFKTDSGRAQLQRFRQQSLAQVIQTAYVKQLAHKYHLGVSKDEVNTQIELVRSQNRLGSSDQVFRDVLREFWGWSVDDFRRELSNQLLAQKVASRLDTGAHARAADALAKLDAGTDFAELAKTISEDPISKPNGGVYSEAIDRNNHNLAPQIVDSLFKLQPGQHSGIVEAGYSLEILKLNSIDGEKLSASHIHFTIQDVSTFVAPYEQQHGSHQFISVPAAAAPQG